jgi:hypothetical protein
MIPVRMGDDGCLHRLPGVDEEITGRAEQAATRCRNEWFGVATHGWTANVAQAVYVAELFERNKSFPS